MELVLDEEQRLLQDSVAGQLAQAGGVKRTRALHATRSGFDRAMLARMGAEGWLGILVPQEAGGLGLSGFELALVLQEAGRHLAPEPIAPVSLSAAAFARSQTPWAAEIRDLLVAGSSVIVPVFAAHRTGGSSSSIAKARALTGGATRLDGTMSGVLHAGDADGYIVETDIGGLAYVEKGALGLTEDPEATVDRRNAGTLRFSDTPARRLGGDPDLAGRLFDLSILMAAAELVGVMAAALDMTVDYLKTRTQFGKPIGAFQALQHRAVDDFSRIVSSRSLLFQVMAQGDRMDPALAAAAKAHIGEAALAVTKSAIQMHGAIGFTDEHDIGLYLKRAMWLSAAYGNAGVHRKRFTKLTRGAA